MTEQANQIKTVNPPPSDELMITMTRNGNLFLINLQVLKGEIGVQADVFIHDLQNPKSKKRIIEATTDQKGSYNLEIKIGDVPRKVIFGVKGTSIYRHKELYPIFAN